jgi:membrane protein YqaA with SNARE-associated domain
MRYNLAVIAVILGSLVGLWLGGTLSNTVHKDDWNNGWQAGFGARDAQVADANSRLIASGICTYARLACVGRSH